MNITQELREVSCEKLENDKIEKENSFTYEEPHYEIDKEKLEEQQDDIQLQVYSPQQLLLFKNPLPVNFDEFNLDDNPKKKVCINWENSAVEQPEIQVMGDLESLAEQLQRDNQKKYFYPKNLPAPSNIDNHLEELKMRFFPSQKQDEFISTYVKGDDLLRIKVGLCDEILNDQETLKFEDWVEQLCIVKLFKDQLRFHQILKTLKPNNNINEVQRSLSCYEKQVEFKFKIQIFWLIKFNYKFTFPIVQTFQKKTTAANNDLVTIPNITFDYTLLPQQQQTPQLITY